MSKKETHNPERLKYLEAWEFYAREGCYDQSPDSYHECHHSYRTPEQWKEIQEDSKRWMEIPLEVTSFFSNQDVINHHRQEFLTKWMPCVLVEEWFTGRELSFLFHVKDGER